MEAWCTWLTLQESSEGIANHDLLQRGGGGEDEGSQNSCTGISLGIPPEVACAVLKFTAAEEVYIRPALQWYNLRYEKQACTRLSRVF